MTNEKKALVPRLRFLEFRDAGEWEEKLLREVTTVLQGYGFPTAMQGKDDGKYPFCKVSDISRAVAEQGGLLADAANYIDDADVSKLRAKLIPIGSTVFAKIGEALRLNRRAFVHRKCLIDNNVVGLKAIPGAADDYFIYLLSQLIDLNKHCGGAVPSVNKSTLAAIEVVLPSPEEQQKIADCLSSLDALIAAQADKIDALKTHKKGLMQQLFPREGETVPRLRFPEFRDAGEWEEYTLGQCLVKQPEYGINAPSVPYSENLPTYLRITDISDDGLMRLDQKVSVAKDVTDENYLEEGDIVLARTGASVGKSYKYRVEDGRLVFAGFLIRVRPDEIKIYSELLFQFLFTERYWRWVDFSSARSGQPGINGKEYASLPLQLPPTIEEQQKISDCLSSLDALIAAHTERLEALKSHKKGLMQQLFPRPEAIPS